MAEPIAKAYKPWMIGSLVMLVGSLMLLAVVAGAAFVSYSQSPVPLWLVLLGVLAAGGVAVGFGGFFLLMLTAAWRSMREAKKVEVIPPEHGS